MTPSEVRGAPPVEREGQRSGASYRVLVVDDSAVIRGFITRALESDPEIAVVGSVANGEMAISAVRRHHVDVVVLDVEMPVMDGLTALPHLLREAPDVKVIVVSTLTRRNAEVTFKALARGASECMAKPTSMSELHSSEAFRCELVSKVRALAGGRRKRPADGARPGPAAPPSECTGEQVRLRAPSDERPTVLAIGSSTGGPKALFTVFETVEKAVPVPVLITQHMPPTFTTILAEKLGRVSGLPSAEAVDGEPLLAGRLYVAPGDHHMTVDGNPGKVVIRVTKGPPENFCRPAVDPLLRGVARLFGPRALALILTGMGRDGRKGGEVIVARGGTVIAQDEPTSVVWGMPGAVATAGLCSAVLPLPTIGQHLLKLFRRCR